MAQEKLFIVLHGPDVVRREGKVLMREDKVLDRLGLRGHIFLDRASAEADTKMQDPQVFEVTATFPEDSIFEVTQNQDMTEGRGPMVRVGLFSSFALAYQIAKGRGVYGAGDGEVNLLTAQRPVVYETAGEWEARMSKRVQGFESKVNLLGYSGLNTSYFVITDERATDPEYQEYLRLREKFKD